MATHQEDAEMGPLVRFSLRSLTPAPRRALGTLGLGTRIPGLGDPDPGPLGGRHFRGALPADGRKPSNACEADVQALCPEELTLHMNVPAVPPERARRGDHAMTRHAGIAAFTHDRPDGPPRPGGAGEIGDIAIRRHTP